MILNKLYSEYDIDAGDLKPIADEIRAICDEIQRKNIAIDLHRMRIWEWSMMAYVSKACEGMRILEVGMGRNPLLVWFARNGCECIGCDIVYPGDDFVELLRREGVEWIEGNTLNLPFDDDFFDFAYSVCVLEHIVNLDPCNRFLFVKGVSDGIREMIRVLKAESLCANTCDFYPSDVGDTWRAFNVSDLSGLVNELLDCGSQIGGRDYDLGDPFEYLLSSSTIFNPDDPQKLALNECLRLGLRLDSIYTRTCASVVLRKIT